MSSLPAESVDNVGVLQFPTGIVLPYLGTGQPAGWYLLKTGGAIELINDYPTLAGLIGNRYGGDGVTTFGTPPAELYLRGPDGAHALWTTFGEDTHLLTTPELPAHSHPITGNPGLNDPGHQHNVAWPPLGPRSGPLPAGWGDTPSAIDDQSTISGGSTTGITVNAGTLAASNAGGGAGHNNLPRSHAVNFIVKT